MTSSASGFVIEKLSVHGQNVPSATVELTDGLNVIAGASNTGKSFILVLIDFLFGASKLDRMIEEAKPYSRASLIVRERSSGKRFEVERALDGGDATLREFDESNTIIGTRTAGSRHIPGDGTTLSSFWLKLSGFEASQVRTNAQGKTRPLSFRDVAFLSVVDEARIIAAHPPHESGQHLDRTVEGSVLRLLATGLEAATLPSVSKTAAVEGKAQKEVLEQLLAEIERELKDAGLAEADPDAELERLDAARAELFASLEVDRTAVVELERQRRKTIAELRSSESRLTVVQGLVKRFDLLDEHYRSDHERLRSIEEAGDRLDELVPQACPICGAPPMDQRPEQVTREPSPGAVSLAASVERAKIAALRGELEGTIAKLRDEAQTLAGRLEELRAEATAGEKVIADQLSPRLRASSVDIKAVAERRDVLLRARLLAGQRADLRERVAKLEPPKVRSSAGPPVPSRPTTADMEPFSRHVEQLLKSWRFPGADRVVFSEEKQDLVISGQPRSSQGKGVRAVTCAAFILGLMWLCDAEGLPHPRIVALDSPLVAYKDPDPSDEELRSAGLAEAFYRSLAAECRGQVLVFENVEPPPDVVASVTHYHFTKSAAGRYGFFPTGSEGVSSS